MTMHQRRRCAGPSRNQERKEVKPEEYTIYERVPALSPGSFDERPMRRNLRITKETPGGHSGPPSSFAAELPECFRVPNR